MKELEKLTENLKIAEDVLLNSPALQLSSNLDKYFKAENAILKYKQDLSKKEKGPSLN